MDTVDEYIVVRIHDRVLSKSSTKRGKKMTKTEEELYEEGWIDGYNDLLPNEELIDDESYMAGYQQGCRDS